ncbi:MAG: F420H2 dehydrogenase subunit FpoJ [Methanosarcinaceae archaeon]
MLGESPTLKEAFIHQFNIKRLMLSLLDVKPPTVRTILNTLLRMGIVMLFLAVVLVSLYGTSWNTVDQLPQNIADQSNIKGIGVLIFTDLIVPFEILSVVLLSSLIGAIYMAKGEDDE